MPFEGSDSTNARGWPVKKLSQRRVRKKVALRSSQRALDVMDGAGTDDGTIRRDVSNRQTGAIDDTQSGTRWRTLSSADGSVTTTTRAVTRGTSSVPPVGHADSVGRQLQAAFGAILSKLPARAVKVADITRWLDLDRSICQRIVTGVRDADDGLGVLERFPGVRGLEQFVAAASERGCPRAVVDGAAVAIEAYARLVNDAGGSQTRLVDRIGSLRAQRSPRDRPLPTAAEQERVRRTLFEGATQLAGMTSAARVEVVVVGPHAGDTRAKATARGDLSGGMVTTASATGMIGIEAGLNAMPLTRRSRIAGLRPVPAVGARGEARPASGLTPDLLLKNFTSDPLPRVTTRTDGEWLVQVFEAEDLAATHAPFDVVAGLAFEWQWGTPPARLIDGGGEPDANFYSVGRVIGPPTRHLVFDVYLHRGLPAPRSVSAHVLRTSTQGSLGNARPQSRWYDRLPLEHDLILLGGAPGDRPSPAYGRIGELTRYLIESMHWQNVRFVGYRFDVAYPVFDCEYVIAVEF
jgi:hypothetical protein